MSGFKKSSFPRQSSYNSLYVNPLNEIKHNRSCSEGGTLSDDKENATPNKPRNSINGGDGGKENEVPNNGFCNAASKQIPNGKSFLRDRALKPSSLQLCMQQTDPKWTFGSKSLEPIEFETANSGNIWDYSDSEAAPASSWATLPNRY